MPQKSYVPLSKKILNMEYKPRLPCLPMHNYCNTIHCSIFPQCKLMETSKMKNIFKIRSNAKFSNLNSTLKNTINKKILSHEH